MVEAAVEAPAEPRAQRPRGRRPRQAAPEGIDAAVLPPALAEPVAVAAELPLNGGGPDHAEPAEAPKRRRGRPRKSETEAPVA